MVIAIFLTSRKFCLRLLGNRKKITKVCFFQVSTSAYHRPSDLYRNAPAEVYRNSTGAFPPKKIPPPVAKKTVTIVPGAQAIVPLPTGGAETSPRVPELSQQGPETAQRALRTSSSMTGPRPFVASLRHQIRKSANFNPMGLPVNTSNYSWTPSTSTNGENVFSMKKSTCFQ